MPDREERLLLRTVHRCGLQLLLLQKVRNEHGVAGDKTSQLDAEIQQRGTGILWLWGQGAVGGLRCF